MEDKTRRQPQPRLIIPIRILIQRHGFAGESLKYDQPKDRIRPLEPEGEKNTRAIARFLIANGMEPDAIFCSPITRAQQTASIMAEEIFGDPNKKTISSNLDEQKPFEMAIVECAQDKSFKRPLLITHSDNVPRLQHLKGKYGAAVLPDPMATSELREIKIKRADVIPGGPGERPYANWKEKQRIRPSDADDSLENLY